MSLKDYKFTIIAFDPGQTTGYAIGEVCIGRFNFRSSGQAIFGRSDLWGLLSSIGPEYVLTESFEFRNRARDNLILDSRNVMGVLELWCQINNRQYRTQTAATGKGYFDNAKLKELEAYRVSCPHANDATRHLLHWINFGEGYKWNAA